MPAPPIDIKLRCKSWAQVSSMYNRDLVRGAIFIRANTPPPLGTQVRIQLLLPSQTLIALGGEVERHIGPGEFEGRGPGVDIRLREVPQSALWLIESALQSAEGGSVARPLPKRPVAATAGTAAPVAEAPTASPDGGAGAIDGQVTQPRDLDMNSGALFVDAEHDLIRALTDELEGLRGMSAYQVLGVTPGADSSSIRAAFAELTKRYHPDLYTRYQSERVHALAGEIFIAIRNAYDALDRAAQRRRGVPAGGRVSTRPARSSGSGRGAGAGQGAPQVAGNSAAARDGSGSASGYGGEVELPERFATGRGPTTVSAPSGGPPSPGAAGVEGDDAGAEASGSARRSGTGYELLDRGEYSQAHGAFVAAQRQQPDDLSVRAGLELAEGMIALDAGDRMEAAQRFEKALQIDPQNHQAAEQLAEMRRRATAERKKFLARLMEQR